MAEEQDDPCLVVLDLEEGADEPSPEYSGIMPPLRIGIGGFGAAIQRARAPDPSQLQNIQIESPQQMAERFISVHNMLMENLPGYRNAVFLSDTGNRTELLSSTTEPRIPGTDRVLIDDIGVATPRRDEKSVGAKSTWLLNDSTLLGNRIGSREGKLLFESKPLMHVARSNSTSERRVPANVIGSLKQVEARDATSTKEVYDTVRWPSDKAWFNSVHVDGPVDFETPVSARTAHSKPINKEFYYINSGLPSSINDSVIRYANGRNPKKISYKIWGTFYEDAEKSSYFANYEARGLPESDPRNWSSYELAHNVLNVYNHMSYDIKYENHILLNQVDPRTTSPDNGWNWANYFYGFVPFGILSKIRTGTGGPDLPGDVRGRQFSEMKFARQESVKEDSPYHWRNIYDVARQAESKFKGSMNLYPVIPFIKTRYYSDDHQLLTPPFHNSVRTDSRQEGYQAGGRSIFYDLNTNIPDLLTKEESELLDVGSKAYFDIRPVYNYYDCLYERVFSPVLDELELPSPYLDSQFEMTTAASVGLEGRGRNLDAENAERLDDFLFSKLVTADSYFNLGLIPASATSRVRYPGFNPRNIDIEGIANRDEGSIRDFAEFMTSNRQYNFNLNNNDSEFVLSTMSTEELDSKYESRYMNPMFVEIELGHVQKSQLAEALTVNEDGTLIKHLFSSILAPEPEFGNPTPESYSFVEQLIQNQYSTRITTPSFNNSGINFNPLQLPIISNVRDVQFNIGGYGATSVSDFNSNMERQPRVSDTVPLSIGNVLDISEWWKDIFDKIVNMSNEQTSVSPIERLANVLRLLSIKMKVKRIINSSLRSYAQFMNGEPAKSEVLGFIIEKYEVQSRGDSANLRHICNFYVMSNNDREMEKFIDTQVKYGSIYEYRIHRVVAVFGNRYMYLDNVGPEARDNELGFAYSDDGDLRSDVFGHHFGVANSPCVKMFVVPTESKRVSVVDSPPVFPNVEFVPYRNSNNEVIIAMTSNTGKFSAPPVILEEDDKTQFLKAALAQNVPGAQQLLPDQMNYFDTQINDGEFTDIVRTIEFKNDDPATKFEIFRLEKHPRTLLDFRDAKKIKISKTSDNCMYKDTLHPDRKYYYVFRVEDIHGNVSNPTHVYEIILRTYDESVRLEVNVVVPENVEEKRKITRQSTRDLQQFIHIKPSIKHKIFAPSYNGKFSLLEQGVVGTGGNADQLLSPSLQEKCWNKTFTLRVRSKNTGKEIDINFKFKPKLIVEENKKENLIC